MKWVESFRRQAHACAELGSPMYAALIDRIADDVERGGVALAVLDRICASRTAHPYITGQALMYSSKPSHVLDPDHAVLTLFPRSAARVEPCDSC